MALVAVTVIIVTGAAVRLTGSGLGCPNWPTCDKGRVVAPVRYHAMVEFVNRTFTGLVSIAVIAAVLGARARIPRRRDLTWLSVGLVVGVLAQIVLGGITVLLKLNPFIVMAHFLLSIALVWNAVVLHWRAGRPDDAPTPPRSALTPWARALVAGTAIVILAGTVVTGAGPHGGDQHVHRLRVAITTVARVHGISELVLLSLTVLVALLARRERAREDVLDAVSTLIMIEIGQAFVGYVQYVTGVPEFLVGLHVLGAVLVWIAVLRVALIVGLPAPSGRAAIDQNAKSVGYAR